MDLTSIPWSHPLVTCMVILAAVQLVGMVCGGAHAFVMLRELRRHAGKLASISMSSAEARTHAGRTVQHQTKLDGVVTSLAAEVVKLREATVPAPPRVLGTHLEILLRPSEEVDAVAAGHAVVVRPPAAPAAAAVNGRVPHDHAAGECAAPALPAVFSLATGQEETFDAADWAAQADDRQLAALRAYGWSAVYDRDDHVCGRGDNPALRLLDFLRSRDERALSVYNRATRDGVRVTLTVPERAADAWPWAHRPDAARPLTAAPGTRLP